MCFHSKRGQAITEMALFGSIILLVLGTLLSYIQQFNNRQYAQMESFRRALEKGCNYTGSSSGGAGAAVSMTLMQNRKQADMSGFLGKNPDQTFSANSSVFWAIPFVGKQAEQVILLRVNEDEHEIDNPDEDYKGVDDISSTSASTFSENQQKQEDAAAIINSRNSRLKETITTTFKDKDDNIIWEIEQGAYAETDPLDGHPKYKYGNSNVNTEINRTRNWTTEF